MPQLSPPDRVSRVRRIGIHFGDIVLCSWVKPTLCSYSASLHPGVQMGTGEVNARTESQNFLLSKRTFAVQYNKTSKYKASLHTILKSSVHDLDIFSNNSKNQSNKTKLNKDKFLISKSNNLIILFITWNLLLQCRLYLQGSVRCHFVKYLYW